MTLSLTTLAAIVIAVCAVVVTAAAGMTAIHMAICAAIAAIATFVAVRENHALVQAGASKNRIAGATARHAGAVWAWGALAIIITYALVLETKWPEWWHFFLGFAVAAAGSFGYAAAMDRDEAKGKSDDALHKVGRTLVIAQAVGVAIGLISMFFDGKFPRADSYADWAGCNIFFFGGLAILAISVNALRSAAR